MTLPFVKPFWKRKALAEMTEAEWESLCDGCGQCCMHKLIDDESDDLHHTRVSCRLLDLETCRCRMYEQRFRHVADCISLKPDNVGSIDWIPKTCAYRLLAHGEDLPDWHPLVCGDPDGPKKAGMSVCSYDIIPETHAGNLKKHVVDWWD